jgi:hypothetical protein
VFPLGGFLELGGARLDFWILFSRNIHTFARRSISYTTLTRLGGIGYHVPFIRLGECLLVVVPQHLFCYSHLGWASSMGQLMDLESGRGRATPDRGRVTP